MKHSNVVASAQYAKSLLRIVSAAWKVGRLLPVYPNESTTGDAARTSPSVQKANYSGDKRGDFRPRQYVRRRSLPFVNVADGNRPELLLRELLDGVFRHQP